MIRCIEIWFDRAHFEDGRRALYSQIDQRWIVQPLHLNDGVELPRILIETTAISLPFLYGFAVLWLGKGRRFSVRSGDKELHLENVSEESAKILIKEFLASEKDGQ